jgi:hypothetical protein
MAALRAAEYVPRILVEIDLQGQVGPRQRQDSWWRAC